MSDTEFERDPFKGTAGNLENLVDHLKDILNCPVTIEDSNHHLLAYSSHDDLTDSARIATIIKRRVPEKVINRLWKAGIIPKLMNSEEPVIIPEIKDIGLGNRVAISIRKKNDVLGYIWAVQEGMHFTEDQLALLKKAAQSARTELLKLHAQKKKKEEDSQGFFWQLLTGHFSSHEEIGEKFRKLNTAPPPQFAVIVFQFNEDVTPRIEQNITYLITTSQKISATFYAIMRKELIIMAAPSASPFTEKTLSEFIESFIYQMETRFEISDLKGCSGAVYHRFDRVETSYQEALRVLSLRQQFPDEMENVFHYQQLGIFRYLDAILETKRFDHYEDPAIEKLKKYDSMNKTNLLETLEVFISLDSNVNEAAKKLHIHANTLNYRLKRIAEIGDVDLKNTNQKMSLYLDLKIKRMEAKLPFV